MSDHQALVEALLMKSILGQELIDTKFHLFSSRPSHPRKVSQLQSLSANDVVLTARSDFLGELLSRTGPPDATFVDFDGSSAFEDGMALDDYGYASDSDLEDEEVETASQTLTNDKKGNTSESDENDDGLLVVADGSCKVDSTVSDPIPASPPQAVAPITYSPIQHIPAVNSRNILVRDTAFRTWKALLLYLYTNKIVFSPLKSQGQPRAHVEGPNPSTLCPCSPKSMYRLGCKVRLDSVRDKAFRAIRDSLNADNILQELSSTFTSKYPAILQMQVQVLIQHIASVPVIQNMPSLIRRIVDSQLPHGADIIIDLYQKFLLQYHPPALALANSPTESKPTSPQSDDELGYCAMRGPSPQPATNGGLSRSPSPSSRHRGVGGTSAFGQSVFGQNAFGQSAFGQSAFGQSSEKPKPKSKSEPKPKPKPKPKSPDD